MKENNNIFIMEKNRPWYSWTIVVFVLGIVGGGAPTYVIAIGRYYHFLLAVPILFIFQILLMLGVVSYLRCIFTHPGSPTNEWLLPKDYVFKKVNLTKSKVLEEELKLLNEEDVKKDEVRINMNEMGNKLELEESTVKDEEKEKKLTIELSQDGSERVCEKCHTKKPDRYK
jgi:hypothetical protein